MAEMQTVKVDVSGACGCPKISIGGKLIECVMAVDIALRPHELPRVILDLIGGDLHVEGAEPEMHTTIGGVRYRLVREDGSDHGLEARATEANATEARSERA